MLLSEQRDISLQAAGHSLSAIHLRQRLFIYQRYFTALARYKPPKVEHKKTSDATLQSKQQVTEKIRCNETSWNYFMFIPLFQMQDSTESLCLKDAEKATMCLAKVGTRAALNFSFAFLRRAWRSGEDTELCSELLMEALEALQELPEASLFDSSKVSSLWIEVLERSLKFLRQVVLGDAVDGRCIVPRVDRHIALSLLLELESQKGTLGASLEAILLLLSLWEKEKESNDNRVPSQNNGAPVVTILRRYEKISNFGQTKLSSVTPASPTESFLR